MTLTVGQRARSVVVEGDRAWSIALGLAAIEIPREAAIDRIVVDADRRRAVVECALTLGEAQLAKRPPHTRQVLRALDLLEDAIDRIDRR
jgi:hypothetical protein